ncbi:MAG: tetratricopeptide repeat protein [Myxococcota bacterium]
MRAIILWGLLLGSFAPVVQAAELTTIAATPLVTTDGAQAWIGVALADALNDRLAQRNDLGSYTSRQVSAALHQASILTAQLSKTQVARELGRHLGARYVVVGSYRVTKDLVGEAMVVDVTTGKSVAKVALKGSLDALSAIETALVTQVAGVVGGELGTGSKLSVPRVSVQATTEALMVLREHSLAPRAADPVVPMGLTPVQLEELTTQLRAVTAAAPTYQDAWAGLGLVLSLRGDATGASASLEKAASAAGGESPETTLVKAFVRMREGRLDVAEKILRDAATAHPGFLHARGSLAQLLIHLGRMREARAAYQSYFEAAPRQPWVLAQVGYCDSKLGKTKEAVAQTQQALLLLPGSTYLLTELAGRQIDAEDLVGAQATLQQVIAQVPKDVLAHVRLGYVQLLRGENAASIRTSEQALKLAERARDHRERAYAHVNLARAYGRGGKLDEAIAHLQQAKGEADISFDEVSVDPALEPLRADPRYLAIFE